MPAPPVVGLRLDGSSGASSRHQSWDHCYPTFGAHLPATSRGITARRQNGPVRRRQERLLSVSGAVSPAAVGRNFVYQWHRYW